MAEPNVNIVHGSVVGMCSIVHYSSAQYARTLFPANTIELQSHTAQIYSASTDIDHTADRVCLYSKPD